MRVLSVGNFYPPHHYGGYELIWRSAMRHLRDAGHEVRVLTTRERLPGVADEEDAGIPVARELRWYWREHRWPRLAPWTRLAIERHDRAIVRRELEAFRPDAVAYWAMGGLPLSMLAQIADAGVPSAAFVLDDWPAYGPRVDAWLRMTRRRAPLDRVDEYVFISRTTERRCLDGGLPEGPRRSIAHSGIAADYLDPAPARAAWGWRLLTTARIDPRKGLDTAIEALALLPAEATLTIAGSGEEGHEADLRALADRLAVADRITWTGGLDRAALRDAYDAADCLLFPVRWPEPWGLVPIEGMARGCAVVASGEGGSGEYLEHEGNALLAPKDDPAAVARAVERLAADAALRDRLRAGGLATARRFTEPAYNAEVEAALARVAGITMGAPPGRGMQRGGDSDRQGGSRGTCPEPSAS